MSFASPVWLLTLLVIPLLAALTYASRARARKTAIRFPAAATLAAAAGGRDYTRFAAGGLAALALAAMALALARPRQTVRVPVEQASIVLVTDHSGSMSAEDVDPSRLGAAQAAAHAFIDRLPGRVKIGTVGFSDAPDLVQAPTTDHDLARQIIDAQQADGGTAIGDALETALSLLTRGSAKHPPAAVVLLSDGKDTSSGTDPITAAQDAKRLNVPVYTVALGTSDATIPDPRSPFGGRLAVPPDPATLREMARITGARAFTTDDAGALNSIYEKLGSQLGTRAQEKEIASSFAIGGLVLLVMAGVASVLTVGRLP
ncbi:MAG TPA: VWA domain-containing protein [Solirubrobacteraceae bacterium]